MRWLHGAVSVTRSTGHRGQTLASPERMRRFTLKALICSLTLLALHVAPSVAADGPTDKDWITGVTVAPGAMTWTSDNFANKKHLIDEIAGAQGKACTDNYAFIGWAPGNGGPQVIVSKTKEGYEKAGYTIEQKPASIETDIVWLARSNADARQAVVLWSPVAGSTIYLSCLTAGSAAAGPDTSPRPVYIGLFLAAALGALGAGSWLFRRLRKAAP